MKGASVQAIQNKIEPRAKKQMSLHPQTIRIRHRLVTWSKSAHGNSGKVAYYEHSWLTKKNGCLLKKAFDCKPFRIQAKILEPMVWEKIEEILANPEIGQELIEDARKRFDTDRGDAELSRIKVRIYDLGQQLDVLAERLSILPKTLSPEPIFKQMEKIQSLKSEEEKRLQNTVKETRQVPAEVEVYEKFLEVIRALKDANNLGFLKAKIIKALVHKIEIGSDSLKIHYRVGQNEIERELMKGGPDATMPPGLSAREKNNLNFSSRSLTNGAQENEVHEHHHLELKLVPARRTVIIFEVEAFPEPKALSAQDLRQLVDHYGGYVQAARAIGDVSEGFFRQNRGE